MFGSSDLVFESLGYKTATLSRKKISRKPSEKRVCILLGFNIYIYSFIYNCGGWKGLMPKKRTITMLKFLLHILIFAPPPPHTHVLATCFIYKGFYYECNLLLKSLNHCTYTKIIRVLLFPSELDDLLIYFIWYRFFVLNDFIL